MSNASSNRRTSTTRCTSILIAALCLAPISPDAAAQSPSTTLVHPPWSHNYGFNRFRQFHLSAYGGAGHELSSPLGIAAVKLRAQDRPGTSDDDEVTVIGANSGANELIYNPTLFTLEFFDGAGTPAALSDPGGVAADRSGRVAVADTGNDRIVVLRFDPRARLVPAGIIDLASTGTRASAPRGVALESGRLYVADTGNDRVVVLDTTLAVRRVVGGFDAPYGIAAIGRVENNYYNDAFAVVTDSAGSRISRVEADGRVSRHVLRATFTDRPGGMGFVAIDFYGNVYATDAESGCVYKFDRYLNFITGFECGAQNGELDSPRGIAVNRSLGQVFIAENTGVSYYWVGTDVGNLRARAERSGEEIRLRVRFHLTEHSRVDVRVDGDGHSLELARDVLMEPGARTRTYRIDGRDGPCRRADCMLSVTVRARPTYASEKHLEVVESVPVR